MYLHLTGKAMLFPNQFGASPSQMTGGNDKATWKQLSGVFFVIEIDERHLTPAPPIYQWR